MGESIDSFYDDLAESYHLMFENWDRSIANQAAILGPILEQYSGKNSAYVLDCACGIGTQALGLAQRGHTLVGSDLSKSAIARAMNEARMRNLDIKFHVADMRNLSVIPEKGFDAVVRRLWRTWAEMVATQRSEMTRIYGFSPAEPALSLSNGDG
jgi:ubiquinone/menaquinone biosynthesis C-methylase UbiE